MKERLVLTLVLATAATWGLQPSAAAQLTGATSPMGKIDFDRLVLNRVPGSILEGEPGKQVFRNGIDMELHSNDPSEAPVYLKASEAHIEGTEDNPYAKITFIKDVSMKRGASSIRAGKAILNLERSTAAFMGSPVYNDVETKNARADSMSFDFANGTYQIEGLGIEDVKLKGLKGKSQKPADNAWLLTANDVLDWPGLLTALKAQALNHSPSPGRRLLELQKPEAQKYLGEMVTDQAPPAEEQDLIIGVLNGAIEEPDFYTESAWDGLTLDIEAKALLGRERGDLSAEDVAHLNRRLLEAAYPDALRARPAQAR